MEKTLYWILFQVFVFLWKWIYCNFWFFLIIFSLLIFSDMVKCSKKKSEMVKFWLFEGYTIYDGWVLDKFLCLSFRNFCMTKINTTTQVTFNNIYQHLKKHYKLISNYKSYTIFKYKWYLLHTWYFLQYF